MPVSFHPAKHPANPITEWPCTTALSILKYACYDQYQKSVGDILYSSFLNRRRVPIIPRPNGLVHALSDAYNYHHAISIRPDDVWITILTQFSFFVNSPANSERLRSQFVNHQRKKALTVILDFDSPHSHAELLADEIKKNINDPSLCEWIIPDFSTTTSTDKIVSSVIMMATLQRYFSYGITTSCGIPKVTLEGQKADWVNLLGRIDKLKQYGLGEWVNLLRPVLSRFVYAFDAPDSQENLDFWQRVVHYQRGGSGPTYLCGWVTAFCVFDVDGRWLANRMDWDVGISDMFPIEKHLVLDGTRYHILDSRSIPAAYAAVPVTLYQVNAIMVAGMVGYSGNGKKDAIQPVPGWWVFEKRDENLVERGTEEEQQTFFERLVVELWELTGWVYDMFKFYASK